jgi:hypothetical protein
MSAKAEVLAVCKARGWTTSRRGSWITIHTGGDSPQFSGYEFNGWAATLEAVRELIAKLDARRAPTGWDAIEADDEAVVNEPHGQTAADDEAVEGKLAPWDHKGIPVDLTTDRTWSIGLSTDPDNSYTGFDEDEAREVYDYESRTIDEFPAGTILSLRHGADTVQSIVSRPTSPTVKPGTTDRRDGHPGARTAPRTARAFYPRSLTEWVGAKIGTPANRKNRRGFRGQQRTA